MKHRMTIAAAVSCLAIALASCGPRAVHPAVTGQAAGADAGGEVCGSDSDCQAGEVCRNAACTPYEGEVGDPCYDDLDCALALRCVSGSCSATIAPDPSP